MFKEQVRMKSILIIGLISVLIMFITGFTEDIEAVALNPDGNTAGILKAQGDRIMSSKRNAAGSYAHVKGTDRVIRIVNNPAFEGFGQFILPVENGIFDMYMQLKDIDSLLPFHNHIDADTTVGVINYMIDEINDGKTIFYDFYPEQQKRENPAKESTGLFFFRGKQGAPFAIVCAGGGFSYVGSIHESFPQALKLSKNGYNAFALQYRVGSQARATEDLAAALSYIFKNAEKFGVSSKDYSLWGDSVLEKAYVTVRTSNTE
jgi:hypothetical protein